MREMTALEHWADALPRWGIPDHILRAAPESPWIHPVASFTPGDDVHVDTPSRSRALEALPAGGSVLDVGCGGGRAAFGLVPPATTVVGVDHQQEMLDVFGAQAASRGVGARTILGDWPAVADATPACDVVVCHHVFYNVADLGPFVRALTSHARRRVVVELPQHHPLSSLTPFWRQFWDLERPEAPTHHDALAAVRETGVDAHMEEFTQPLPSGAITDNHVAHTRVRLCLTPDRDPEVRAAMEMHRVTERSVATIWWDSGSRVG
ncbi:MAG: class I SAM-dependent methyltransferase [Actinomycetota bacterium]